MSPWFRPLRLLLALLPVACTHEAPVPSPYVPVARLAPPAPVVLDETPLRTSQDWDGLLDAITVVGGEEDLLQWLPQAAQQFDAPTLARTPGARQLTVQAVYRAVRAPNFSERFETIRGLVDALQAAAPDAPETIFARAFLRWILMSDGKGHLALHGLERSIAVDLQRDLRRLVEQHPAFDGPGEFDRDRLRRELAATDVLLAETATPTGLPASATPDGR